MESLSDTTWDVVICGTGIRQSLLALALSRSGKKILHIDQHKYYGGTEAAFSLQDASSWIHDPQASSDHAFTLEPISLWTCPHSTQLGASRSYTLTLSPHLIYSQSALLPALVSSRLHTQLDFQAVGPWWICKDGSSASTQCEDQGDEGRVSHSVHVEPASNSSGRLQKIPSTREDVFADNTISARDKRSLMRFLRSVLSEPAAEADQPEVASEDATLSSTLTTQFGVAASLHQPLLALSLSYNAGGDVKAKSAMSRIRRHMRSIGAFGPGFGAVMPKYGGTAEIAQVGCRASAVGGAVYVLGRGLKKISKSAESELSSEELVKVELSDGEEVQARFVVGCAEDLPAEIVQETGYSGHDLVQTINSISVVSSSFDHLFPPTSEGGPVPAGAVVVNGGEDRTAGEVPTYMVVHASDSGECPPGQCVIYSSTSCLPGMLQDDDTRRLDTAVACLLDTSPLSEGEPQVLWSFRYRAKGRPVDSKADPVLTVMSGKVMMFPPPSIDLAFDDSILESVKEMWKSVMKDEVEEEDFLKFEERGVGDEEGS